jgi:hypothetical protein
MPTQKPANQLGKPAESLFSKVEPTANTLFTNKSDPLKPNSLFSNVPNLFAASNAVVP